MIDVPEDFFGPDIPKPGYDRTKTNQKIIKEGGSSKKKKPPNHTPKARKYWEALGYYVEDMQAWQPSGMSAYVKKDFIGSFDLLCTKSGCAPILVQICAKSDVRGHLRKILGDSELPDRRTRRSCFSHYIGLGWNAYIHHFEQPGGHGSKWLEGVEPITPLVIDDIDNGRRMKRG